MSLAGILVSMMDEISLLLGIMPPRVREALESHPHCEELLEVVLDLGRLPDGPKVFSEVGLSGTVRQISDEQAN